MLWYRKLQLATVYICRVNHTAVRNKGDGTQYHDIYKLEYNNKEVKRRQLCLKLKLQILMNKFEIQ